MPVRRKITDRYETLDILGKGGMGLVYKAYDTVVQREVALKTLRDTPSKLALDLFRKECGVLASMSHPNIVEIFDIGEFNEDGAVKPYFVMPLLPGVTLDHLIRTSSQRLTVERTVEIIMQTCRGLHAAHERGLVHRDLKPSNIFVMPDDAVKIIDFGVAHMADTTATMTVAGGTLPYMAPEQLEMKPASPLSDIFSLGVVFYESLTRRRPFDFPTEQETAQAIMHHVPPAVSELNPAVSQMVSRVIHKAMAKQPWNRFSTAKEFAETLLKAQRNEPIEIFDTARLQPRIQKATKAYEQGNYQFAAEILNELEAEGHVETSMTLLRRQLDQAVRQKTINQLLESARTCMEEEEYLLALQKIQEIVQLDPTNSAALTLKSTIETRRSEAKVEEWMKLARQHLENNAFSHAREALKNLLQLQPKDTTALQMLSEVDRREEHYVKSRQEKEQLYKAALEAWQSGEMSSALTKLERLVDLDRRVPDTSAPERGISYQNFYNQVRSEHDLIQGSYQEARKYLVDGNFTQALAICQQYLSKYPGHALFQALKFDVEERQRQDLSARVAEIDRRVESEPDLDRRVNILKEALDTYPGEPHFERALRLARDKRDLVNSIVSKGRSYEERSQFNEAQGQWEILQTIHKQYPGLEFEIERVRKRRDQQSRSEAKARWVEQIDRQLESGDYDRAIELLHNAAAEFPDDAEMVALGELAKQSQARAAEAQEIFKQGQQLSSERRYEEAIETLRRAFQMDQHNKVIRAFLIETLMEHARAVIDTDWRTAESLSQQALELDPAHALARGVSNLALDRKRDEEVSQWVAEARRMQAAGNFEGALSQIDQGLTAYPRETRLTLLQSTLFKSAPELQTKAQAAQTAAKTVAAQQETIAVPSRTEAPPAGWEEFERRLREQASPEQAAATAAGAGPVSQAQGTVAPPEAPVFTGPSAEPTPSGAAAPPVAPEASEFNSGRFATMVLSTSTPGTVSSPLGAAGTATPPVAPPNIPTKGEAPKKEKPAPGQKQKANPLVIWISVGAGAVLIFVAIIAALVRGVPVEVRTNPPGATVRVNGEVRGTSNFTLKLRAGKYQLEARKDGYLPTTAALDVKRGTQPSVDLVLKPTPPPQPAVELPQILRLATDLPSGKVKIDEQAPADLQDGQFTNEAMGWGPHTLEISAGSAKATIKFEAAPRRAPVLTEAPAVKEMKAVVVTSFGNQAHVQSSYGPVKIAVNGQPAGEAGPSGTDIANLPEGNIEMTLGEGKEKQTVNFTTGPAPALSIFLNSDRNVGTLLVLTGEDGVQVLVNGKPYRRLSKGGQLVISNLAVKDYTVSVQKEGFQQEPEQHAQIQKGAEARLEFHLRPVPTVGALMIRGALPGAQVLLDQKSIGAVAADGSFSRTNISPGNHMIELTDGKKRHKHLQRSFKAGETVQLGAVDVVLTAATGTLRVNLSPADSAVTYRGPDGKPHDTHGGVLELEEGTYTFTATAPGHVDRTQTIQIAGGKSATLDLKLLTKVAAAKALPVSMEQWATATGWTLENGWYVHRGGGFVLYPTEPVAGTFVFSGLRKGKLLGAGRMQWVVGYTPGNYALFGIDKKNFYRSQFVDGKKQKDSEKKEALKTPGGKDNLEYNLKIDISADGVVTSVQQGGNWITLDTWNASGTNPAQGRFGFYLPGTDEFYVSNFSFTPK